MRVIRETGPSNGCVNNGNAENERPPALRPGVLDQLR